MVMTKRSAVEAAFRIRAVTLRPARPEEAKTLSILAIRSKSYWGYDDDFIEACREDLTVQPEGIDSHRIAVAVVKATGRIVGFYGLVGTCSDDAELSALFVEPEFIGGGVGRLLFDDARGKAMEAGFARFRIEADPFAATFYEHMGAIKTGTACSHAVADRLLPVYTVEVLERSKRR
jgi:GNAT superfamily N-acetyltransferase